MQLQLKASSLFSQRGEERRGGDAQGAETKHVAEIIVGDVVVVVVVDAAFVLTALFMANLLIFSSVSSLTLTPSFPGQQHRSNIASD